MQQKVGQLLQNQNDVNGPSNSRSQGVSTTRNEQVGQVSVVQHINKTNRKFYIVLTKLKNIKLILFFIFINF